MKSRPPDIRRAGFYLPVLQITQRLTRAFYLRHCIDIGSGQSVVAEQLRHRFTGFDTVRAPLIINSAIWLEWLCLGSLRLFFWLAFLYRFWSDRSHLIRIILWCD